MEFEKERLSRLIQMAEELVEQEIQADQIVVVETAKSNVYHFENHLFAEGKSDLVFEDEKHFVEMLQENADCEIQYIVCMWKKGSVEIPTMHFRKLLLEVSPKNAEARFVVLTEDGNGGLAFGVRTIGWSMPAKKESE